MKLKTPVAQVTDLWRIDSRLAQLGRGVGAMRLHIGEGLSKLETLGGIQSLGFPTLESYAREALGRSGRWGADVRSLARRLTQLPQLRKALVAGVLTTSMVELVVRFATPENEGEWVARAQMMTVREMRVHLKSEQMSGSLGEVEDDLRAPRSTITMTVDRLEAWAFERARAMVEAVGATRGDGAIEALLAEGLGELLARDGDIDLPSSICGFDDEGAARALRAELALLREQGEAAAESAIPPEPDEPIALTDDHREVTFSDDLCEVHLQLRGLARELARRDVELAMLARQALDLELWKILRFHSFDHYCRERMGLSPSSVATRIALARRMEALPEVEDALAAGRIGYESATLIARVAGPTTVDAWVARATARTVKHLREEIDAVELVARVAGRDLRRDGPPDAAMLDEVHEVERAATAIVSGQMSVSSDDEGDEGQVSGGHDAAGLPTTQLRLSMTDEVAQFWRGLERLHTLLDDAGESFVAFLVRAATKSWRGSVDGAIAYADVYQRDRWRCASPVCRSRNVTPHHVVFRSQGGGEAMGNLLSLCTKCHLELVHMGHLQVEGDAGAGLVWKADGWGVAGRLVA